MRKLLLIISALFFGLAIQSIAQDRQITGKVTSSQDGLPLIGVSIALKGSTKGTTTNAEGVYKITVPSANGLLSFSFIGFATKTFTVGSRNVINVALQEKQNELDEVVVGAFGLQKNEREIGSSIAKIKGADLSQANPTNLANGLTAKVSGLQISTVNNGVNPGVSITLRGNRSLLGNNQALLVVDGIITPQDFLAVLNPNDVESTSILKGSGAAALYGSDASNGVLVVNLKKGSGSEKPTIFYSYSAQNESVAYMPGLQQQFGSNGGEGNPFLDKNGQRLYVPFENQSFGPAYDGSLQPLGYGVQVLQPDGSYKLDTLKTPYSALGVDPRKDFFKNALTSQHDIAYRVGKDDNYFSLSLQQVNKTGIVPNDVYQRSNISIKAGRKYDKFTTNIGLTYSYQYQNVAGGDFNQGRPVYWNVLNSPAHAPLNDPRIRDINSPYGDLSGYFNAYYPNPWWQVSGENSRVLGNNYALRGHADIAYQFTDWLKVLYRVGGTNSSSIGKVNVANAAFSDYAIGDPWGAGNIASSVVSKNANTTDVNASSTRFTGDLLITINPKFGDFETSLTLGHHLQQDFNNYNFISASSLKIPDLYNVSNRIGEPAVGQGIYRSNLVGAFADFSLGYKKFAFVHVSGRNDWTSLLSPANRSFFYPAIDASVILLDAIPGLKNVSWLDYLKVRGGIAKVGNINVSPYQLQNTYNQGGGFPFGGQVGFGQSSQQNDPNLKPEFTTGLEMGFEVAFLKKFNLEVSYYKTNTTNQTVPIQVSRATGFTSANLNTGEMQTRGVEVDLKIRPIVKFGDFYWDASVNYSYNTSEVISLYGDLPRLNIPQFNINTGINFTRLNGSFGNASSVFAAVGQRYPALYLNDVKRVDDPANPNFGKVIIDPVSGYPTLDPTLKYQGSTQPLHRLGFVNTFHYKNTSLSIVAEYRGGAVIYNQIGNSLDFTGVGINSASNGRQNFVYPNSVIQNADGTFTPNTSVSTRDGNLEFWTNSAYHNAGATYVNSADFWKLREVALTYTIPKALLAKTGFIKDVAVSLTGRNLLMLRPKTNVYTDPEFSLDGSNAAGTTNEFQTPPTRMYGFRLSVGF